MPNPTAWLPDPGRCATPGSAGLPPAMVARHRRASAAQRPEQPHTSAALQATEPSPGRATEGATPTLGPPAEAAASRSTQRPTGPNEGKTGSYAKHDHHATTAVMRSKSKTE